MHIEFAQQAYSGLFQLLPLGLRVQEKVEKLLDKHMLKLGMSGSRRIWDSRVINICLGASKLSLSTFSSEDLWKKTGRLGRSSSEVRPGPNQTSSVALLWISITNRSQLFRLQDRKGGRYLLSPTHEEEITSLVASIVKSHKELPLRLYQICSFCCLCS